MSQRTGGGHFTTYVVADAGHILEKPVGVAYAPEDRLNVIGVLPERHHDLPLQAAEASRSPEVASVLQYGRDAEHACDGDEWPGHFKLLREVADADRSCRGWTAGGD